MSWRVPIGVIVIGALLSGCGASAISPSQSGTLANAALAGPLAPKRFNPFDDNDDASSGKRIVLDQPTLAQVLETSALEERSIGSKQAPVTVIKYASLTCPYCRQFQANTFPVLKKRYIDTGRVRFVLREFPIGFQSGAATIALRCVPRDKYFEAYAALLKTQPQWISQEVRREPIFDVVKQFGLTRPAFDACYEDKALVANLNAVKERGRTLGVIGTPNFFVNNMLYKRVLTMTDFDQLIGDGALAQAQ